MVEILIGGASMTSREVSFVVTEEYRAWIENIKQKNQAEPNQGICESELCYAGFVLGYRQRHCDKTENC